MPNYETEYCSHCNGTGEDYSGRGLCWACQGIGEIDVVKTKTVEDEEK